MCITELDRGGAEKAFVRIALGLQQHGWTVRVLSLRDQGVMAEPLLAAGLEVVALGCGHLLDLRCFPRLWRQLRNHPCDVLLTFLHQANLYGRLAARAAGVPVVVSGIRVADRRPWLLQLDRWTRCCVDHYIAVSPSVASFHAAACGIGHGKVTPICNGVDFPDHRDTRRGRSQKLLGTNPRIQRAAVQTAAVDTQPHRQLLFVGRLTEQKNPLLLLDVLQQLPASLRDVCDLTFIGDGPLKAELQQQVERRGLTNSVRLMGAVDDVTAYFREADVLLLPSRWEGLPNVALEAMAAGVPVVASRVDGVCDVLTDGETGWLLDSFDPCPWGNAVTQVLTDEAGTARRVQTARRLAEQHFSWPGAVAAYDRLLRQLRSESRRRRGGIQ